MKVMDWNRYKRESTDGRAPRLHNRMLAHSIDACTHSASRKRRAHAPFGTIAIWLSVIGLIAVHFVLK